MAVFLAFMVAMQPLVVIESNSKVSKPEVMLQDMV